MLEKRLFIALGFVLVVGACDSGSSSGGSSSDATEASVDGGQDVSVDTQSDERDTALEDTAADAEADSRGDTRISDTSERDAREGGDADGGEGGDTNPGGENGIRIELTWRNPEDPDESDDEGADLDLHFIKLGPGRWFESPYDVYFRNPNKMGDEIWNPGAPQLLRIDDDGAGPEIVEMGNPQECEWYGVGVHYYEQLFGTAYASVQIFVDGTLAYENLEKPLREGGTFWDVARIHARSYEIKEVDRTRPDVPLEEEPVVTDEMEESGLCTAQGLY